MAEGDFTMDDKIAIRYNDDYLVVQANELIKAKKDDLSLLEAKLIRIAISQINQGDNELYTYSCRATDLAKYLGIPQDNVYRDLQGIAESLMSKKIRFVDKTKKPKRNGEYNYQLVHWTDTIKYEDGIITIKLANELGEYLLGLNKLFTEFGIGCITKLGTSNAISLYELLASYAYTANVYRADFTPFNLFPVVDKADNEIVFSLDYLKAYFNCEGKYKNNGDFIKRVIEASVKQINENDSADSMKVSFRTAKEGRSIGYVLFKINAWGDSDFRDFVMGRGK